MTGARGASFLGFLRSYHHSIGTKISEIARHGLSARTLSVGYGTGSILSDVNLELRPGEVLAIIGPNGAGKTTLLKTFAGEMAPLAGYVSVTGEDVASCQSVYALSVSVRSRIIARVLQNERPVWPLPVREYVAAGTFPSTGWFGAFGVTERDSVDEALVVMDLLELASRPVTELSGGEFRRVLIARALAQRPSVLLLDEPVADLDLARQVDTLGRLKGLAAVGRTVAFTVHDLNLAAMAADRVALVAGGRLLALGSPRDVITVETIAAAYGAAVLVGDHPLGDFPQIIHAPSWLSGNEEELKG